MTDEKDPADVLARAHRAWSPTAADAERVRRAVAAAVASGAATGSPSPPRAAAAPWAARFLVASALAAASGGVGYWAGHRAGLREARVTAPAAIPVPSTAMAGEARPVAPPPIRSATAAVPSLVPTHHDARLVRHAAGTETRASSESLAAEVQGLRNAERALRDGNPGLALAFLAELERQVPGGQLTEERDAAATLAHCASGDRPFGVDLGEEFTQRHPTSVYRARVEQACQATDPGPAGDKSLRRSDK
jgi:hypothetical protein